MEYINANPNHLYYGMNLQCNKFTRSKSDFVDKKYREYLAVYRIQRWWHQIRLNPRHPVGRRRLEREYDALFGQNS
jgi:hypothetical protein